MYLSETLNKNIYAHDAIFGKVIDFAVKEDLRTSEISHIVVKQDNEKFLIESDEVEYIDEKFVLLHQPNLLPFSEKFFYLAEDLLDKQVIDITGKRLVRVNDVLLRERAHKLYITSIDIGFSGILRRLGIKTSYKALTIPWSVVEAFDYQSGDIRVKLSQSSLNTLQPADLADILEEAGTKERLGIVEALDATQAAAAVDEADTDTQAAILEQVTQPALKSIASRMHVSEIADVLHKLNPFTEKQILSSLDPEKARKVRKLALYADDSAGGLMDTTYEAFHENDTVEQVLESIKHSKSAHDAYVITTETNIYRGTILLNTLLTIQSEEKMKNIISDKHAVQEDTNFDEIMELFADYNLRVLPVIDSEKKVLGIIKIDYILSIIKDLEEVEDAV